MKTTSFEFIQWMAYLDELKIQEVESIHYYLAQIAAEIRRSWVDGKFRADVKLSQFLLKFHREKEGPKKVDSDVVSDIRDRTTRVKQFFFALTGYSAHQQKNRRKQQPKVKG